MGRFILTSHGDFAKEAVGAVNLIMGDLSNEFDYVSVLADKSPEDVYEELKSKMDINNDKKYFVFCDIYGGTPFNVSLKLAIEGYPIELYTGLNLTVLLEVAMLAAEDDDLIVERIDGISDKLFQHVNISI